MVGMYFRGPATGEGKSGLRVFLSEVQTRIAHRFFNMGMAWAASLMALSQNVLCRFQYLSVDVVKRRNHSVVIVQSSPGTEVDQVPIKVGNSTTRFFQDQDAACVVPDRLAITPVPRDSDHHVAVTGGDRNVAHL